MRPPVPGMASDSRSFFAFGNFSGVKCSEPSTHSLSQRLNFQPAMNFRETIEFKESRPQQVARPEQVRAGMVVKRRGYLDQALKEHLVRARSFQPHFFPMFVSLIEMIGIERFEALLIQPVLFVRIQALFGALSHLYR
jgi:hypothetical protein